MLHCLKSQCTDQPRFPLSRSPTHLMDLILFSPENNQWLQTAIITVKQCQEQFNLTLPSIALERRRTKFLCINFVTWSSLHVRSLVLTLHCHCIFFFCFLFDYYFCCIVLPYVWRIKIFHWVLTRAAVIRQARTKLDKTACFVCGTSVWNSPAINRMISSVSITSLKVIFISRRF